MRAGADRSAGLVVQGLPSLLSDGSDAPLVMIARGAPKRSGGA